MVGGGPAGSSAAITMARAGVSVTLLERGRYDTWRVGEHLPPHAGFLLGELGISPDRLDEAHAAAAGRNVRWGATFTEDYLSHPLGRGWFLDRALFDSDLAQRAAQAGANVRTGVRVTQVQREEGGWHLTLDTGSARQRLRASFLIEATGRSRIPGILRTEPRRALDRQIAIVQLLPPGEEIRYPWLHIEAAPSGWWYRCPLPCGGYVVCHLTDPDLLGRTKEEQQRTWHGRLSETRTIMISDQDTDLPLRRMAANSYLRDDVFEKDRPSIGDAIQGTDPLSGQGIVRALWMGRHGGEAVVGHLSGEADALPSFAEKVQAGFRAYATERQRHYAEVRYWPQSPYWFRRQFPGA